MDEVRRINDLSKETAVDNETTQTIKLEEEKEEELWTEEENVSESASFLFGGRSFSDTSTEESLLPHDLVPIRPAEMHIPAKIVFMGDRRVGTSTLLRHFFTGTARQPIRPSVSKVMKLTKSVFHPRHGCYVTVQFWDVEGSDKESGLECSKHAHAVIIVYDVGNRSSFELAQTYLDSVNPRARCLIIANKIDSVVRRVSRKEGLLLARIHRVGHVETSALSGENVAEAMALIIDQIPDSYLHQAKAPGQHFRRLKEIAPPMCSLCHREAPETVINVHHQRPRSGMSAGQFGSSDRIAANYGANKNQANSLAARSLKLNIGEETQSNWLLRKTRSDDRSSLGSSVRSSSFTRHNNDTAEAGACKKAASESEAEDFNDNVFTMN